MPSVSRRRLIACVLLNSASCDALDSAGVKVFVKDYSMPLCLWHANNRGHMALAV